MTSKKLTVDIRAFGAAEIAFAYIREGIRRDERIRETYVRTY